jgi:hypothetical protein
MDIHVILNRCKECLEPFIRSDVRKITGEDLRKMSDSWMSR